MTRRDLVLAILAAAEGRPYTPVQIQKAVFLVCDNVDELIDQGPGFNFQPYDYGPFDSDVYSEIDGLQRQGLAVVAPSPRGSWNTYAATDAGIAEANDLFEQEIPDEDGDYIKNISNWVRSLSFSSLVKSIYEEYPEMRANSIFKG